MKKITVRKNQVLRCCFRFILLLFSFIIAFILFWKEAPLLLVFIPLEVIFGVVLIYMESWQILFFTDHIEKQVFFLTVSHYSYSDINDIYISYSVTDHEYVVISYANQKRISFQLKDVNASKALKILRSHKSITLRKP